MKSEHNWQHWPRASAINFFKLGHREGTRRARGGSRSDCGKLVENCISPPAADLPSTHCWGEWNSWDWNLCNRHSGPQQKWQHHCQSSDPPVFSPHLCEMSLVPHLVAQLQAGKNPGSRWCHWTAHLGDAGNPAHLGRPGFSHGGGIGPPHLKDRSKVWHSRLGFIILMTAGHWEASTVPRFFTRVVIGTQILPVLTLCVDNCWTECGRLSINLSNNTHDGDIWRGETLQAPLSERTFSTVRSDNVNNHVHHIHALECDDSTLTSPWPSGPLSGLSVHRPRAGRRITSEEDKILKFGGLHVWMALRREKKGSATSLSQV